MKTYLGYFNTFEFQIITWTFKAESEKEAVSYFIDYARENNLKYLMCDTLRGAA